MEDGCHNTAMHKGLSSSSVVFSSSSCQTGGEHHHCGSKHQVVRPSSRTASKLWPIIRRNHGGGIKSGLGESYKRRPSSLPPTPAESFTDEEAAVDVQKLRSAGRSLGVGTLQKSGRVEFESNFEEKANREDMTAATSSLPRTMVAPDSESLSSSPATSLHYLRITDLRKLDLSLHSSLHSSANETESSDVDDVDGAIDQWQWLGCATNSPVAVNALAEVGWSVAMNPNLWSLASGSLSAPSARSLNDASFRPLLQTRVIPSADDNAPVLVWTGKLHGLHRSDLPAVRAATVLDVSPRRLAELLVDSGRVREYNPHSQGRVDLQVLQSSLDSKGCFGGLTKVVRSSSKPPLLRKPLEFTSLFHARSVMNGGGYLIVTRSVSNQRESLAPSSALSEILLSVNLLLPVGVEEIPALKQPDAQQTLMVTVNHICSPLIPTLLAKRIGVQAAASYLGDLKQCIKTM